LFPKLRFPGLVRVSFGIGNSEEDVNTLIRVVDKIARHLRLPAHKDIQQQMDDFANAAARRVYTQL
jgi:hypothetical protein